MEVEANIKKEIDDFKNTREQYKSDQLASMRKTWEDEISRDSERNKRCLLYTSPSPRDS